MANTNTLTRAPKGGITIMGVFYRGGQFLPTNQPQRGKWNKPQRKATKKARKQEIAPYTWEYAPEDGMMPLYSIMMGCKYDHDNGTFSPPTSQAILNSRGWTSESAQALCDRWNSGERWEWR